MAIESIPLGGVWAAVRWVPGFLIRRYFPAEKLGALIYVDLFPRNESATINLGEAASFQLYVQVINLSPFEVELDRGVLCFWCGGATLDIHYLERARIASGATTSLRLSGSIPDGKANQISRSLDGNHFALSGSIQFNCNIHNFKKNIGHLDYINVKVHNAASRRKDAGVLLEGQ